MTALDLFDQPEPQGQTFTHPVGWTLRTFDIDGTPWAIAADVCTALGLTNVSQALAGLDDDEKGITTADTPGGAQRLAIVNEPGLYSLILRSRRPEAKAFKRWVTHEILPEIRRTGSYRSPSALPTTYAGALRQLAGEVEAREEADNRALSAETALGAVAPKVEGYDALQNAEGLYSVKRASQAIGIEGIGQNNLFRHLRDMRILQADNTPMERFKAYFEVKIGSRPIPTGGTKATYTTLIRPGSVDYLRRRLLDYLARVELLCSLARTQAGPVDWRRALAEPIAIESSGEVRLGAATGVDLRTFAQVERRTGNRTAATAAKALADGLEHYGADLVDDLFRRFL